MPDIRIEGITFRTTTHRAEIVQAYLLSATPRYDDPYLLDLKIKQIDREVQQRRTEIEELLRYREALLINQKTKEI